MCFRGCWDVDVGIRAVVVIMGAAVDEVAFPLLQLLLLLDRFNKLRVFPELDEDGNGRLQSLPPLVGIALLLLVVVDPPPFPVVVEIPLLLLEHPPPLLLLLPLASAAAIAARFVLP